MKVVPISYSWSSLPPFLLSGTFPSILRVLISWILRHSSLRLGRDLSALAPTSILEFSGPLNSVDSNCYCYFYWTSEKLSSLPSHVSVELAYLTSRTELPVSTRVGWAHPPTLSSWWHRSYRRQMFAASWGLCGWGSVWHTQSWESKPGFFLVLSFLPGVDVTPV